MINIKIKNDTLFTIEKGVESIDYPRNFYAQKVDGTSFEIIHFESRKRFLISIWYLMNVQIEGINYTDVADAVSALNAIVYNSASGGSGSNPLGYSSTGSAPTNDLIVSIGDVNDENNGTKVLVDDANNTIDFVGRMRTIYGMDFNQGADLAMYKTSGFPPFGTTNRSTFLEAGELHLEKNSPFIGENRSFNITPDGLISAIDSSFSTGTTLYNFPAADNDNTYEEVATRQYMSKGGWAIDELYGATLADPSSVLELVSNTKGFLIPRMTTSERDLIVNPVDGLLVYNITTKTIDFRKDTVWHSLGNKIEKGGIATNTAITVSGTGYTVLNDGSNTIQYTIQKTGLADIEFTCSRSNNQSGQLVFIRIERNGSVIKYSSYASFVGERHAGQVRIEKVGVNAGDIIRISTNGSTTTGGAQHTIHNANLMVTVNPIETIL